MRLLLIGLFAMNSLVLFAEGTKQLSPTAADTTALTIDRAQYGSFGRVGGVATSRLNFHLGNPDQEQVYLGFSQGYTDIQNLGDPGNAITYYFRILNEAGVEVQTWQAIDATTANLSNYGNVQTGPAAISSGGYSAFNYTPTIGAAPGDYYVEFTDDAGGAAGSTAFYVQYFDITVATRDVTPSAIDGRVFSRNWAIAAPPTKGGAPSSYGVYDRPFKGIFYVYSRLGFVSEVDFSSAGFQPFIFNVSFNEEGTATSQDILNNVKSISGSLQVNPVHEIFLNDPDNIYYPNGEYGSVLNNSEYPKLVGCSSSGEYAIRVATTKAGIVEVLFDQTTITGAGQYDPGTVDRLLMYEVEPAEGESPPFIREIPWDGKDGLGADISATATFDIRTTYAQVAYHLPIYDAEYMLNGFEVTLTRPTPPNGYQVVMQYDNSNITELAGTGSPVIDLNGCAPPCNSWDNFDFGDGNTINTYWYARRQSSNLTLSMSDPDCGCAAVTDLSINGTIFNDANGSFIKDLNESDQAGVVVRLYKDDNKNDILEAGEFTGKTATTDANGDYSFSETVGSVSTSLDQTIVDPGHDGMDLAGGFYAGFNGVGTYNDGAGFSGDMTTGLYFDNLQIPPGATITSATLEVEALGRLLGGTALDLDVTIEGVLNINPSVFSTSNFPSNAAPTVASETWTVPAAWAAPNKYTSADISSVISELISQPNFELGNPLALVLSGTGTNVNMATASNGASAPKLTIGFTGPDLPTRYFVTISASSLPSGIKVVSDTIERAFFTLEDQRVCNGLFRVAADRDGDGVVDSADLDNDNDGIPDTEEKGSMAFSPTGDEDGDGVLNFEDDNDPALGFVDDNLDGIHDRYDADGDGIPDVYDLDSDNDGVTDLSENGGFDTNGDGIVDIATDTDGDGLADVFDNNDTDGPLGSGIDMTTPSTSALLDSNADGINEGGDADGDGIANAVDLDADGDGIADIVESGGTDANGDGRVDASADADGDGLADTYDPLHEGPLATPGNEPTAGTSLLAGADTDGDGIVDRLDRDSDNDGITDAAEAGVADVNGDGIADDVTDTDGDGLSDLFDATHDGPLYSTNTAPTAGTAVVTTGADSGDGTPTSMCSACDADGDSFANWLDRDADNDGITDLIEQGGNDITGDGRVDDATDTDGDGIADIYDPSHDGTLASETSAPTAGTPLYTTGPDTNSDGLADSPCAACDADGDGIANAYDLDADNDGIADIIEAYGTDTDGDGRVDVATDLDADGIADILDADDDTTPTANDGNGALVTVDGSGNTNDTMTGQLADFDGDGFPNWLDRDTDNDGISDLAEAGGNASMLMDADDDGRLDMPANWDEDGDGLADVYDSNVNDGPGAGGSTNGTALITSKVDANNDGMAVGEGLVGFNINQDGDAQPNYRDLDSDNDGITDVVEQNAGSTSNDLDGGDLNGQMTAGASDFVVNNQSTPLDSDGDGVYDYLDIDADNDGIPDNLEAVCSGCPTAGGFSGSDTNLNGVDDAFENLTSTNATGGNNIGTNPEEQSTASDTDTIVDYLDIDTDGDLAFDWSEGFDVDGDGMAADDLLGFADTYRTANSGTTNYPDTDTDNDGIPDWMDNLIGDGYTENQRPPFLDPNSAYWVDANNNGLADLVDGSATGGTGTVLPDIDNANDRDWRDNLTAAPLPVTLIDFSASVDGCDILVTWTSTQERDFSHYIVETSRTGNDFAAFAKTYPKAIETAAINDYDLSLGAQQGEVYIRLKMVDNDGTTTTSDIILATTSCGNDISVYPNPVKRGNPVFVEMEVEATLTLIDATGRTIETYNTVAGERTVISTANLAKGVYTLYGRSFEAKRIVVD